MRPQDTRRPPAPALSPWMIKRLFAWLTTVRRVAARTGQYMLNGLGIANVGCILIAPRHDVRDSLSWRCLRRTIPITGASPL